MQNALNHPEYSPGEPRHSKYERAGVTITQEAGNFVVSYLINHQRIEDRLPIQGPEDGAGELRDERVGVHAWFDRKKACWVLVHTYLIETAERSDWQIDTAFLHPDGDIEVREGYDAGGRVDLEGQFYVVAIVLLVAFAAFGVYKVIQYGFTGSP